jgi:hypothetical protein
VPQIGEYHDNCKPAPQVLEKVLEQVGGDAPEQTWKTKEQLLKRLGFSQVRKGERMQRITIKIFLMSAIASGQDIGQWFY